MTHSSAVRVGVIDFAECERRTFFPFLCTMQGLQPQVSGRSSEGEVMARHAAVKEKHCSFL
jgi:hypothetical protein